MNKAHVFQHKYTGHQMFIYGQHPDENSARDSFTGEVFNVDNWIYLGLKTAIDCNE